MPSANPDSAPVDRKSAKRDRYQSPFSGKACKARLVRPNNSLKPRPLRGLGAARYDWSIANAAQRSGLAQALACTLLLRKRIQERHLEWLEVHHIPGNNSEAMHSSRRGDHCILVERL